MGWLSRAATPGRCEPTRTWPGCAKAERGLAGDPEADALTNNGQGPPSITGRLRRGVRRSAGSSGPRRRRSSRARGGAGLPLPAPPGRCRVRPPERDAAPRAAAAATSADHRSTRRHRAPPGRGGNVAAEGVGGAFGYLGGVAEGAAALAPTAGEVAGTLAATAGVGAAATAGLARAGCWRTRSSGLSRAARTRPCRRSANGMNDATQPQHFTLRSHSSTSGSPASSRASSQSFRVQNPVTLPQSQPNSRASSRSSGQSEPPASAELRPAGTRHRGGVKNLLPQTPRSYSFAVRVKTRVYKEAWR